jgi:hypothetical protein
MATIPAERQVVWWHSISCVCRRCLEHDLFATVIEPLPASWQILPADGNDTSACPGIPFLPGAVPLRVLAVLCVRDGIGLLAGVDAAAMDGVMRGEVDYA